MQLEQDHLLLDPETYGGFVSYFCSVSGGGLPRVGSPSRALVAALAHPYLDLASQSQ